MLEDRDDVGKALMKCRYVDVCLLLVEAVQPIEQSVRGLVRNYVMRQASENHVSAIGRGREVAEKQRPLSRAVVGVGLAQRVRVEPQPAYEGALAAGLVVGSMRRDRDLALGP